MKTLKTVEEAVEQLMNNTQFQNSEPIAVFSLLAGTLAQHTQDIIEMMEGMKLFNQKKQYDGNNLESACDVYNCAFQEWGEVIRYEHGHDVALTDIQSKLRETLE